MVMGRTCSTLNANPLPEEVRETLAVLALYVANRASVSSALDEPNLFLAAQGSMNAL